MDPPCENNSIPCPSNVVRNKNPSFLIDYLSGVCAKSGPFAQQQSIDPEGTLSTPNKLSGKRHQSIHPDSGFSNQNKVRKFDVTMNSRIQLDPDGECASDFHQQFPLTLTKMQETLDRFRKKQIGGTEERHCNE